MIFYQKAENICLKRSNNNPALVAFLYVNIANLYNKLGNFDEAQLIYLKAYDIKKFSQNIFPAING